jgi:hypothetical protein
MPYGGQQPMGNQMAYGLPPVNPSNLPGIQPDQMQRNLSAFSESVEEIPKNSGGAESQVV